MAGNLVITTGGSSGIGRALLGATPWADARRIDVSRRGAPGAEHWKADLADPAAWRDVAAHFERELTDFPGERIVCFQCAGTLTPMGFAGQVDAEAYTRNVLLNSAAPQVLGDAFLRAVRGSRACCDLVFIGSGAAASVYAGWTSYGASKAAVAQWTRTAGAEQSRLERGCRVLCIAPGVVETSMQEEIRSASAEDFPEVARFVTLHEEGGLRDADAVAREIWSLLERGDLANGSVLDLRELSS